MAKQSVTHTLPYDPVWKTCNELVNLANTISAAATSAIADDKASHEMVMIRLSAERMGLLADNIVGGDLCGNAEYWANLPDMNQAEGES